MNENIRLLTEADYILYKTIRLQLLKDHPSFFGSDYEEESSFGDSVWKSRLAKDTVDTYGLFTSNQLVGLAVVVKNPRKKMKHIANLNSMYIKSEYQNQGLGSKLIDRIIKDLINKGLHRLNLSVVESNQYAKKLYLSKGFIHYGTEPESIYHQGKYHNLYLMSLLLR
ncbi:GNAT family N-acetyltransferase [Hujiaoplasma nucleasis]|uniref:GNAT family N-acetyltransferase n=1 Tax=Hujiaoplasma nucleasis TaxID=2725268 RepID=A0A7L6N3J3_9MOLU|nr:GNAT family N-acetyltransferase [Hujiaoplasma nucleasis]QLY40743.1 GNAT family N-acetyltransferase [Hujiaoplasma nucleasis]